MHNNLFLLSNSVAPGRGYLEHAMEALRTFLEGERTILFVPYALANHDSYTTQMQQALAPLGMTVTGLHTQRSPRQAIEEARVLFVGGGNSFRLLKALQQYNLLEPVRRHVAAGELRYIGSSAGTNMACPSLRTTNDMPIVRPGSFETFGLVPFQINPHYPAATANGVTLGETREQRIEEFLEENDVPVLGMREGSWLLRHDNTLRLEGLASACLFVRNAEMQEIAPGTDLSRLLETTPHFDRHM